MQSKTYNGDPQHVRAGERRSLMWLGAAAMILAAASVGLIAYEEAMTRPVHFSTEQIEDGR
jgi:hypothetical protein